MHLLLGNSHVEGGDYELAIQLFEHARDKLGDRKERPPLIISLVYLLPSEFMEIDQDL